MSFNCCSQNVFQVLEGNHGLSGALLYLLFDFLLKLYARLIQILDFALIGAAHYLAEKQLSLQCQLFCN